MRQKKSAVMILEMGSVPTPLNGRWRLETGVEEEIMTRNVSIQRMQHQHGDPAVALELPRQPVHSHTSPGMHGKRRNQDQVQQLATHLPPSSSPQGIPISYC